MCDNHINMYLWMNGKAKMKSKKDNNDEWLQLLKGKHDFSFVVRSPDVQLMKHHTIIFIFKFIIALI